MKQMKQVVAMWLVGGSLAIGACGGGAGGAEVEAFVKLDTDKAAAFDTGGDDCAAKAKVVGEWRKAHTADYNKMRKALSEKWGKEPPKDVQDKYGEQMKKNKKSVIGATMKCANDPAFSKMMDDTKTADQE